MKKFKYWAVLLIGFLVTLNSYGQTDLETIKDLLRFTYFPDPTQDSRFAVNNEQVSNNELNGRFWTDTGIDELQTFVKAILQPASSGGDATLQNYVAQVLKLNNRRILIYLWNDSSSMTRSQYAHRLKPCISDYDRSESGVNNRVWPCANYLSPSDDPNWGGYVHVGQYYGQDKGLKNLKATFIHEFMHTQDPVSALNNRFVVNNHLYRYGADGTHFFTEALPNKRAAYKEAVANVMSLMFNGTSLNYYLTWYATNGDLLVERQTPSGFFRFFQDLFGYSDNVWLYDQIKDEIGAGTPDAIVRGYDAYPVRSLPPRFIVHNETVTALALALTSLHVRDIDPFMFAVKKVNTTIVSNQQKDPVALIVNKMALGLTSRGDSLSAILSQLQSSGVINNQPYYIVLPLAYFDYFTGFAARSKNEFNALFNNEIDPTLLNIYWNYFKDRVRTVAIMPTSGSGTPAERQSEIWNNLTDVSIQCGVNQSMMEGVEDFNFEPPSTGPSAPSEPASPTADATDSNAPGTTSDGPCQTWPSFGTESSVTVKGVTVPVFNASTSQKTNIEQTLNRLPASHIRAIPRIIVVSDDGPNYFLSHPERGGASWRCSPAQRSNEWIKLSSYSLSEARNRRINYTLLHEIGHFIDRDYNVLSGHTDEANRYLRETDYSGHTQGAGEAIAQGYMYYFATTTASERSPGVRERLPRYLIDILENSSAWSDSSNWQ